jgi:hypothetical protein
MRTKTMNEDQAWLGPAVLNDLTCLKEVMEALSRKDEVPGCVVEWLAKLLGQSVEYLEQFLEASKP